MVCTYSSYFVLPLYVDAPIVTPEFAVLFPGEEVLFTCNTPIVLWSINGVLIPSSSFPAGLSIVNTTTLAVNMSANATTYACGIIGGPGIIIISNAATLVLPG